MRAGKTLAIGMATAVLLAPTASAGPADLDPSFGDGGLAVLAGGDRYDAQFAPLLTSGGGMVAAGLLRNSSDRVFLNRLTAAGATDTAFGDAGEVHSNSVAPFRSAPTAQAPDGKLVVVAGSSKDGRIVLERFTKSGAVDTAYGPSGNGRLKVDLAAGFVDPTAAVALPGGGVLVAALTDLGGSTAMTVLKFTTTGLDTSFGAGGAARATFTKVAGAFDLAVLPNGKILAVGALGDWTTGTVDTALARFTATGQLDSTFGTGGKASLDTTGTNGPDLAVAVAVDDATGAFAVTGPAGGRGMVARFSSTGAPATTMFGSGGVQLGGFTPAGTTFLPADIALDAAGRMVVAGTATTWGGYPGTSRWLVARLTRTTGSALDTAFAPGGTTQLTACANTSMWGPSGVAVQPDRRIVVLGSCGDSGAVAAARLLGGNAFPTGATLAVSPGREAAGHERVPLTEIDPVTVLGAVDRYASAPLGSGPLGQRPARLRSPGQRPARQRTTRLRTRAPRQRPARLRTPGQRPAGLRPAGQRPARRADPALRPPAAQRPDVGRAARAVLPRRHGAAAADHHPGRRLRAGPAGDRPADLRGRRRHPHPAAAGVPGRGPADPPAALRRAARRGLVQLAEDDARPRARATTASTSTGRPSSSSSSPATTCRATTPGRCRCRGRRAPTWAAAPSARCWPTSTCARSPSRAPAGDRPGLRGGLAAAVQPQLHRHAGRPAGRRRPGLDHGVGRRPDRPPAAAQPRRALARPAARRPRQRRRDPLRARGHRPAARRRRAARRPPADLHHRVRRRLRPGLRARGRAQPGRRRPPGAGVGDDRGQRRGAGGAAQRPGRRRRQAGLRADHPGLRLGPGRHGPRRRPLPRRARLSAGAPVLRGRRP